MDTYSRADLGGIPACLFCAVGESGQTRHSAEAADGLQVEREASESVPINNRVSVRAGRLS